MNIIMLVLWLVPIGLNVYWDKDGRKPNYLQMFMLRGITAILHGIVFDMTCRIFPPDLYRYSMWELVLIWTPLFTFQVTSFWILFELGLNLVRGREAFYFDRKERDSGWIDKIFDHLGSGAHLAAKIMALILCVLSILRLV